MGEKEDNNFTGHILKNASTYKLWKFQITAYMRSRGLTDNIEGKVPADTANADEKSKFDRNEGKAMNAIIQSIDTDNANLVLDCKSAKAMMDQIGSVYEKNSEIRAMILYEEYFTAKMRDDERVAAYISRVNQLASDIEQQKEKLTDNLKMARIIAGLTPIFNNYKTVWYNTTANRTLNELMSSLQLEEENLNRLEREEVTNSNAAFSAKTKKNFKTKDSKPKSKIDEIKKKTKCNACGQKGHWARDKVCPKFKESSDKGDKSRSNKESNEMAWCSVVTIEQKNEKSDSWYADSAAIKHMTFHREWFSEIRKYTGPCKVEVANKCLLTIESIGTILIDARIDNQWKPIRLENVLYVPELSENLFSTGVLTDKGVKVLIEKEGCKFIDSSNKVVAVGKRDEKNRLKLDFRLRISEYANMAAVSLQHWHRRLGHVNVDSIKKMCNDGLATGVDLTDSDNFFCEDCQYGKMTRATHKQSVKRASSRGEYMHVDLCGPSEVDGINGMRYFMLIKDEATSFRFTYFLKSKDEAYAHLKSLVPLVKNMNGTQIKFFRFDNGREFFNRKVLINLLKTEGIQFEGITPYTPEQNGRIERDNRTVQESARTMLIASGLPKSMWTEAVRTATYLLNRTTNSNCVGTTPYEKWFDRKPYLGHIKIFGTECFVQIPKQTGRKKWDPKAKKAHLVGFEPTSKNFRLYDPESNRVFMSCNVKFNEKADKYVIQDESEVDDDPVTEQTNQEIGQANDDNELFHSFEDDSNQTPEGRHNERYSLRPKVNAPSRLIVSGFSATMYEPTTYDEAIGSEQTQQWKCAMDDEYNALIENQTWELVEAPKDQKVIDNRWVFKVKQNPDGTIERYKARLVVRGFTQQYGVDYEETFSPVARYTSIRLILSLAAINKMKLKQFDVKTAFLYGELKENVYMKQPVGYEDGSERVCKLKKSLYGLKQASRCWNQKFTSFIRKFDFKQSAYDACVFVRQKENTMTVIAIYVDDGLIATNNTSEIDEITLYLQECFEIKVSEAKYFLGLQIERLSDGSIRIHQGAYAKKVLSRFNMMDCNPVSAPMDCNQNLGDFVNDEHYKSYPYRQAVGSLMYLTIGTRPDISYAVGVVSRYLDRPSAAHVEAVKRIMKYIRGTLNTGILYESNDKFDFVGYSDADHAGDTETRKSTSGYVFHIGSGVISWASMRQDATALSSTESEYMAACQATKELVWLKGLLYELTMIENLRAKFYIDNMSAIKLVKNPVFHKRTKHIGVQYHYIREKYEEGYFELIHVCTADQIADILTKALNKNRHKYLCNLMNLIF